MRRIGEHQLADEALYRGAKLTFPLACGLPRTRLGNAQIHLALRSLLREFEELSDGPVLLADFVTLQFNGQGIRITPSREFDEDEFSDAELEVMQEVMEKYGDMNSDQLIAETHREGSLWFETAKEHGLLEDFDQKRANTSSVIIDMARFLSPEDREYYEESRELHEFANKTRVEYARCEAQGLSKEQTAQALKAAIKRAESDARISYPEREQVRPKVKERMGLMDQETMRENLHQMVKEVYAQP